MEKFVFGVAQSSNLSVIPLEWRSRMIDDDPSSANLDSIGEEPGVYAIEGCHDGAPSKSILYIGKAGARAGGGVNMRLPESMSRVWWTGKDDKRLRLFSDLWDVRVRWAHIKKDVDPDDVETLLILAHSPAFNSQKVRTDLEPDSPLARLVVLNGGQKGTLLPAVVGAYYCGKLFPHT